MFGIPWHYFHFLLAANSVYMTDMPPPYPGINGYNGYATAPPSGAVGFTQPQSAAGKINKNTIFFIYNIKYEYVRVFQSFFKEIVSQLNFYLSNQN